MRVESDMNDADIQKFFNSYVRQANPSALCKRVVLAVRENITDNMDEGEKKMLLDFANAIEKLGYAQRKIEASFDE